MTAPRTELFAHIGGPYDGADMPVEVDGHGVPVEHHIINDITAPDMLRNPATTIQSDDLRGLYERDTVLADEGLTYVFRFRSQDVFRNAA